MYYPRAAGQVAQKYEIVSGVHTRRAVKRNPGDDRRLRLVKGDTFHPTPDEIANFGDKFRPVMAPVVAEVAAAPAPAPVDPTPAPAGDQTTTGQDEATAGADEAGQAGGGDDPDAELKSQFASDQAFDLWVEKGRPSLEDVERTGHGGKTYSKKDIESL